MLAPTMYPLTSKLILMNFPYKSNQIILMCSTETYVFKVEVFPKSASYYESWGPTWTQNNLLKSEQFWWFLY